MELTQDQKELLRLRREGKTLEQIAEILELEDNQITNMMRRMRRAGIPIADTKRGPKKTQPMVATKEHYTSPSPKPMNCKCEYMGCRTRACYTWALVPLCESHFEAIKDETNFYYGGSKKVNRQWDRVHYMTIANLIPWAETRGRH